MLKQLLLHGPAKIASRTKLFQLKSSLNSEEVTYFDEGSNSSEIVSAIQTIPMFGSVRTIVLENPDTNLQLDTTFDQVNLLVWFDSDVSKSSVYKQFVDHKKEILFFAEGQELTVFPFLDMLGNRKKTAFVEIERLKMQSFDIYYFLTMAYYLLRNLTVLPQKLSPFQKQKLAKQKNNFSEKELITIFQNLLKLEFQLKSGLIDSKQAEFRLINEFMD